MCKRLREEFERSARLLYDRDGVAKALIEAAQRHDALIETEKNENDRAFDALKAELERDNFGKWAVIAVANCKAWETLCRKWSVSPQQSKTES